MNLVVHTKQSEGKLSLSTLASCQIVGFTAVALTLCEDPNNGGEVAWDLFPPPWVSLTRRGSAVWHLSSPWGYGLISPS